MDKREFLQLAHEYVEGKHPSIGMYMSEKLDGQRALWDGGISRGIEAFSVPYANTAKHGRFVASTYATGLWSRYGQPIQAPDSFLDQLPKGVCFDGEIFIERDRFQDLGFIRERTPDLELWLKAKFAVFDAPAYYSVFQDGKINNTNFQKTFVNLKPYIIAAAESKGIDLSYQYTNVRDFHDTYTKWKDFRTDNVYWLEQVKVTRADEIQEALDAVTDMKGEGIMLRAPFSIWQPTRTHTLLKLKKLLDAEATVTGYTSGRETTKGSKLLGMMGALIVDFKGRRLELSGFTDEERMWEDAVHIEWCRQNPGTECPSSFDHPSFPKGSVITFRYRTLTDDGIPREARYWRHRGE